MSNETDDSQPVHPHGAVMGEIAMLLEKAHPYVEKQLKRLARPGVCADEVVVLVMDGTSPLINCAPPEGAKMLREGGAAKWVVQLVDRAKLALFCGADQAALASQLALPRPCGHVPFVVSIAGGAVVRCTDCDMHITAPTAEEPS